MQVKEVEKPAPVFLGVKDMITAMMNMESQATKTWIYHNKLGDTIEVFKKYDQLCIILSV